MNMNCNGATQRRELIDCAAARGTVIAIHTGGRVFAAGIMGRVAAPVPANDL